MSVGTVSFYRMKGSLSSGEYPLLSVNPSLTPIATFTDVLYKAGLQASVDLPYFTGLENVNIARIGSDYYWVTDYKERTADATQYTFTLDFMAPTTMLHSGDTVSGTFHKTATNVCPYLRQEISNGLKMISNSYYPSDLEIGVVRTQSSTNFNAVGYWVQVTGFTVNGSGVKTSLKSCGFIIGIETGTKYPIFNEIETENNILPTPTTGKFPTFNQLIQNITAYTGLQADQIIDVSISKRCPFRFRKTQYTDGTVTAYRVNILRDNDLDWVLTESDTTGYYYFDLTSPIQASWRYDNTQTITIDTSSAYIRQCGSIAIRDWNDNTVMEIPIDGSSIDLQFRVHSDISGVYTIITHKDQQISVPEGHIPYIENSFETYKAYQLNGDRQAMENAIKEAAMNKDLSNMVGMVNSTINAISTGAMTGAIAGNVPGAAVGMASGLLGSALNLWQSERARELSELQTRNAMELSRRRAIDQPQTSYNVAYGMIYSTLNELNALRVCVIMPYNVDSGYFTNWCAEYGYPCEGVRTVPITTGYYQGKINASSSLNGMRFDELNRVMMNGFKFVLP